MQVSTSKSTDKLFIEKFMKYDGIYAYPVISVFDRSILNLLTLIVTMYPNIL